MKILIYSQHLEVGGTQVNAIELAAALRDLHGFEPVLFAGPGPMASYAEAKGLRLILAPEAKFHPSRQRMRLLSAVVREERPDIVHVWDWWQCLDAYCAVHLRQQVPMVVSDMMMSLTRILPKRLPTTFGVPELVDRARAAGRKRVELMLPAVDVLSNAPDALNGALMRTQLGIDDDEIALVTVSRLSHWMKSESLIRTIDAVRALGMEFPLKFVIVGDGLAKPRLQELAESVNLELKREAVIFAGAMLDPRPAYAAADIVVGMGGSALRGMAFGKPVIVVGERAFSEPLNPETAQSFYYRGIYGLGDANPGNAKLESDIRNLAERQADRAALGEFARNFVLQHFSLEVVSSRFAQFCRQSISSKPRLTDTALDGFRTAAIYFRERRFLTPSS